MAQGRERRNGSKEGQREKRDDFKKGDFKKGGFKKDDSKRDSFKREGFKKDDSKKDGFKKDDSKKGSFKREGFKKDDFKRKDFRRNDFKADRMEEDNEYEEKVINELMIEGRNAIIEALKADRTIDKILTQKGSNEGSIRKIIAEAKDKGIVIQEVEKIKLDTISGGGRHQGVIAFASAHDYVEVKDILAIAKEKGEQPFIVIMENLNDPHNLGAVLRTANAVGAHGVIIPKRRSVGLTAVVGKASAGAIEYTPVAKVTNISRTIEELQKEGLWVACADMDGEIIYNADLKGPIALVVGSEGDGVSRLVKEKCDYVVSIPMYGQINSLNASVAASLLMYEVVRQRKF